MWGRTIRPLIFGNGRFLVCEDNKGVIRDIYYPHVGIENHGKSIRVGVYDLENGDHGWIDEWDIQQRYKSTFTKMIKTDESQMDNNMFLDRAQKIPYETKDIISNIGESIFENRGLGVKMTVWDVAHPTRDIFYRVFDIKNISSSPKRFRTFSTHNYNILENKIPFQQR